MAFTKPSFILKISATLLFMCTTWASAQAETRDSLASNSQKDPVVAAYFAEWSIYDREYSVAQIPANSLTHIIYAFAKPTAQATVEIFDSWAAVEKPFGDDTWDTPLRGNFNQLIQLKKKYPHLKTLIAIGGWTLSDAFSSIAATPQSRKTFAQSAVRFMKQYDFDGIDMDWEYPTGGGLAAGKPEDRENFTLLMQALRDELDAQGKADGGVHYLLTVASAAGSEAFQSSYELAKVADIIDWFNLMAYDYHGAWEDTTNHQAALDKSPGDPSPLRETFNVSSSVSGYLESGVPAEKIVLGLPLYSRGWSGVGQLNNGLFQSATGPAQGSWEPGVLDYSEVAGIAARASTFPEPYGVFEDLDAQALWIYIPDNQGSFITFENAGTVKKKIDYVKESQLRGVMFWELSGDIRSPKDPQSLVGLAGRQLLKK